MAKLPYDTVICVTHAYAMNACVELCLSKPFGSYDLKGVGYTSVT